MREDDPFDETEYLALLNENETSLIGQEEELYVSDELLIENKTQEQVNLLVASLDDNITILRIINCALTYLPQPPLSNCVILLEITGSPKLKLSISFDDLSYFRKL